jgi:hypothetical protein
MTNGIETKIFRALTDRLDAFIIANPIAVAYPGRGFTPTQETPYLRVSWLPARTEPVSIKTTNDYTGLLQISVFWPDSKGIVQAVGKASEIIAHFRRTTFLYREGVRVKIHRPPYAAPAMQEPGWVQIPVDVPYQAFVRS